jgi:16S rRNA (guanine966-N2)-methyltransferase
MRIVGGRFKGRSIAAPEGSATRPTSDRVREAVFNILAHGMEGFTLESARVIDLFAGSGALGFESLSRGSRWCHFIDDAAAGGVASRANADKLGLIGQCKIWRRDATDLGFCAPLVKFDLAFADPPYGQGLGEKSLCSLVEGEWLNEGAVVVLEESIQTTPPVIDGLELADERGYGETVVRFYKQIARSE